MLGRARGQKIIAGLRGVRSNDRGDFVFVLKGAQLFLVPGKKAPGDEAPDKGGQAAENGAEDKRFEHRSSEEFWADQCGSCAGWNPRAGLASSIHPIVPEV